MADWEKVAKFLSNKVVAKSSAKDSLIDLIKEFDLTDDELKEIGFDEEYIRGARDEVEGAAFKERYLFNKKRIDASLVHINQATETFFGDLFENDDKTASACETLERRYAALIREARRDLFEEE